ncbi:MAG: glucokinase [Spongiibacteraceae bacterium]
MKPTLRLVGDIGGTNARFALAHRGDLIENSFASLHTDAHASLPDAIRHYLNLIRHDDGTITDVRIAIAGPVGGDAIAMTNANWHFSIRAVNDELRAQALPQLQSFKVINDFAAQALALPHLLPAQVINIGGIAAQGGSKTVLGPGTGFGAACIAPHGGEFVVLPSEGGHAGLAPETTQELAVFKWLLDRQLPITRETLLSGPGLERLHRALADISGHTTSTLAAADIVNSALAGDPFGRATLAQFCLLLGTAARDQALSCGTRGGVYIGGGIVLHFTDFFIGSDFRQRFETSSLMADYLHAIPTYLINTPNTGLIGAAHAD